MAQLADIKINMFPAKGTLLIFGHRVNHMVINRCRKPANGDILVPDDAVCVIGTTSDRVPFDQIDDMRATPEEVDLLIREGMQLAPSLSTSRILRAYAGVRPLVASDDDPSGRSISRGIIVLDHEQRDGLKGFITVTGGKMMTYRLMAEQATNLACKKLGIDKPCETATTPLPGSEESAGQIKGELQADFRNLTASTSRMAEIGRHGTFTKEIPYNEIEDHALVGVIEEAMGVELTDRIHYIRTIMDELQRLDSHLLYIGCCAQDLGALTAFLYSMRDREHVLNVMEETTVRSPRPRVIPS